MKNSRYLTLRIVIAVVILAISWYLSPYLLPAKYKDDHFGFIGEIDTFFRVSITVFIMFILYMLVEVFRYQKKQNFFLRNNAIGFIVFLSLILLALITGSNI